MNDWTNLVNQKSYLHVNKTKKILRFVQYNTSFNIHILRTDIYDEYRYSIENKIYAIINEDPDIDFDSLFSIWENYRRSFIRELPPPKFFRNIIICPETLLELNEMILDGFYAPPYDCFLQPRLKDYICEKYKISTYALNKKISIRIDKMKQEYWNTFFELIKKYSTERKITRSIQSDKRKRLDLTDEN